MDDYKLAGKEDPGCQGDFQDMETIHKNHTEVKGPEIPTNEATRLTRPVELPMNQADQAMKRLVENHER